MQGQEDAAGGGTVPLGRLRDWDGNPRTDRSGSDVAALADSIESAFQIQPLAGRPAADGCVQVVAGGTRLAAFRLLRDQGRSDAAGRPFDDAYPVRVDVRPLTDQEALAVAIAENTARQAMGAVDQAEAILGMVAEQGISPAAAARRLGLTRAAVEGALALARLPARAKAMLRRGERPVQWGAALAHAQPALRERIAAEACPGAWETVDAIRQAVREGRIPASAAIFDAGATGLAVEQDLLGGEPWFADPSAFWSCQNAAIERLAASLEAEGHAQVTVLRDAAFEAWRYMPCEEGPQKTAVVCVSPLGAVTAHRCLRPAACLARAPLALPAKAAGFVRQGGPGPLSPRGDGACVRAACAAAAALLDEDSALWVLLDLAASPRADGPGPAAAALRQDGRTAFEALADASYAERSRRCLDAARLALSRPAQGRGGAEMTEAARAVLARLGAPSREWWRAPGALSAVPAADLRALLGLLGEPAACQAAGSRATALGLVDAALSALPDDLSDPRHPAQWMPPGAAGGGARRDLGTSRRPTAEGSLGKAA